MSKQQAYVEELRRSQHDNLVAELSLRQRNIVFPDTVRNEGVFYRNLAGKDISAFTSHRVFAFLLGVSLVITVGSISISGVEAGLAGLLLVIVGLKIALNALASDHRPAAPADKTYPHVKI
jgi:hypothetical protein